MLKIGKTQRRKETAKYFPFIVFVANVMMSLFSSELGFEISTVIIKYINCVAVKPCYVSCQYLMSLSIIGKNFNFRTIINFQNIRLFFQNSHFCGLFKNCSQRAAIIHKIDSVFERYTDCSAVGTIDVVSCCSMAEILTWNTNRKHPDQMQHKPTIFFYRYILHG